MFKTMIFKGAFIICAFFILDTIKATKGCQITSANGTPMPDTVLAANIKDNKPPGVIALFFTDDDISGFELDPSFPNSRYLDFSFANNQLSIILTTNYSTWEKNEPANFDQWLDMSLVYTCGTSQKRQNVRAKILEFSNNYAPEFDEANYEITLPMPLHKGYYVAGGCTGAPIKITDYDYNLFYRSNVEVVMGGSDDLEIFVEKDSNDTKTWSVSITTKATFIIEKEITIALAASDEDPSVLRSGLPRHAAAASLTIIPDLE